MLIKRFAEAQPYQAPNHFDMCALRLQGFEPGGPTNFWVGHSQILPGGRAGPDSSPIEKTYVMLEGELTIRAGDREEVLRAKDSVTIAPGETREIVNQTNHVGTMLVLMPYPPASK